MGCGTRLIISTLVVSLVWAIVCIITDDSIGWGIGFLLIFPLGLIAFFFGIVSITRSRKRSKASKQIQEETESIPTTYECEECGAEISVTDKICPKCGVEFEGER